LKIAGAMHSLSETYFVLPYQNNRPKNIENIEKVLCRQLDKMTEIEMTPKANTKPAYTSTIQ
ncbi:MAG: hypothetical protein Q8Q33_10425, partial [Chlamydiota bacterium]|nr:hypothetical protein [Chlamydiota bacterium]